MPRAEALVSGADGPGSRSLSPALPDLPQLYIECRARDPAVLLYDCALQFLQPHGCQFFVVLLDNDQSPRKPDGCAVIIHV